MAITTLSSGQYAELTLVRLPSIENNYLPVISGNSGYPTDNKDFKTFMTSSELNHYEEGVSVSFGMVTIKEGQNYLNIPLSLTECRKYNYAILENAEMCYYYYISDYECLNAEVTRIHLVEDTIQTWFPYITNFNGQLARSHLRRFIASDNVNMADDIPFAVINPDLYSVDTTGTDINYKDRISVGTASLSDAPEQEISYCLVVLNVPSSNYFTYQDGNTKYLSTQTDYPSWEVAVNSLQEQYYTADNMMYLITGFATWAEEYLTGYESLVVTKAETDPLTTSSDALLQIVAFETSDGNTPMNTYSYGGYEQYIFFAVRYNLLSSFFQSFPQFADYIVDIIQLPKGFDVTSTDGKWVEGFEVINCERANGTNTYNRIYSRKSGSTIVNGYFYLITDITGLRGVVDLSEYEFASLKTYLPNETTEPSTYPDAYVKYANPLISESGKIALMQTSSKKHRFVCSDFISYGERYQYGYYTYEKSIENEYKLDLYPYKYYTYDFFGGISIDVYYNNFYDEKYTWVKAWLFTQSTLNYDVLNIYNKFFLSLDTSSTPTWSVAYSGDYHTLIGNDEDSLSYENIVDYLRGDETIFPISHFQSDDIVATTYAYSYDSWSEYANYSKALTESNLKYTEKATNISIASSITSAVMGVATGAVTLGTGVALGNPISSAMGMRTMMTSSSGMIGSIMDAQNQLAKQRSQVATNQGQLARKAPTLKSTKSNRAEYYNKVAPLDDATNTSSGSVGKSPSYPTCVLTTHTAEYNQRQIAFRNYDLYGYITPYYVVSMDRGSDEWYGIYYSRYYRNYIQWEDVNLRFDDTASKPTYMELEDLRARLINGVNFVHLPIGADDLFYKTYDEMMSGYLAYENLDTLSTNGKYQTEPYFWKID